MVVSALQDVRNNIIKHHDEWYHEVEDVCRYCTTSAKALQPTGTPHNLPADDPSTYYRCCIFVPMVDHLLSELHTGCTTFSSHHRSAMLGLSLVPYALVTLPADDVKSNLTKLVYFYTEDLHSCDSVNSELHSWTVKWELQMLCPITQSFSKC